MSEGPGNLGIRVRAAVVSTRLNCAHECASRHPANETSPPEATEGMVFPQAHQPTEVGSPLLAERDPGPDGKSFR